jgi:hypothetical protein
MTVGLLASACSGTQVVSSKSQALYFQVPPNWTVYGEQALEQNSAFSALLAAQPHFYETASANPHPRPNDAWTSSEYPWAIAVVMSLTGSQQMGMSFEGMSTVMVPLDQLSTEGFSILPLSTPETLVNGNLHGALLEYELQGGAGSGPSISYEQETWVNSATNNVWALLVGCNPSCFTAQKQVIDHVVQTFYVADRGNQ